MTFAAATSNFDPEIIPLDEVTEGQACTVLKAAAWIDNDEPLLIYNADTYCRTDCQAVADLPASVRGLIGVFRAPGDKWSFARADARTSGERLCQSGCSICRRKSPACSASSMRRATNGALPAPMLMAGCWK